MKYIKLGRITVAERINGTEIDSRDQIGWNREFFQTYSTAVGQSTDVKESSQLAVIFFTV
jgi:hypothetical protein